MQQIQFPSEQDSGNNGFFLNLDDNTIVVLVVLHIAAQSQINIHLIRLFKWNLY